MNLTPAQQSEADRIEAALAESAQQEIRRMAELLASKQDHELLGQTEFQIRDILFRIGAEALTAAAEERKKGGITVPI